jgi:hypothetical protein
MIGGLITSTIHLLFVTPVIFSMMKEAALKREILKGSKPVQVSDKLITPYFDAQLSKSVQLTV